jgi:glycosyltransferase involved in cell wall biosynthesis
MTTMSEKSVHAPRVSIIVPAYNAARFLGAAIESAFAQTLPDWEMLVVDDGSKDDTLSVAERYAALDPRVRVFTQSNAGPSVARNRGYKVTHPASEAVVFLDADDFWEEDALETLVGTLAANPSVVAAYGLARTVDAEGRFADIGVLEEIQRDRWGVEGGRVVRWPEERPTTFAVEAVMERIITPGTVLIRRGVLEQAGLWDPDLRMWEDWDLWLRVTRVGNMAFVDKPVLRRRWHDSNLSHDQRGLEKGPRVVRRKLLRSLRQDPEKLRIARIGLQNQHRYAVRQRLARARKSLQERHVGTAVAQACGAATALAAFMGTKFLPPEYCVTS